MKYNSLHNRLILGVCFLPFLLFAQEEPTQTYQEVVIQGHHLKMERHNTLEAQQIEEIAPSDLGMLLQYINGITIKNYGGIGGMKTLSHRGLGGEHTQLVIDGTPISNPQSGQINFSTIPANNIEKVQLINQSSTLLIPVSALVKGSSILVNTFSQTFSPHPFSLRSTFTLGSFGQKKGYLALKKGGKQNFMSLSGGYQTYRGNYPYALPFGDQAKDYYRTNNKLTNYSLNLGTGFRWKKNNTQHILKAFGKIYSINQELPGAVVLYNDLSKSTLETHRLNAGVTYRLLSSSFDLRSFISYANRYLHYHDPNYLNLQGFLDNLYTTNSFSGGFHTQLQWKSWSFHLGDDLRYDALKSNRELGQPNRISNTAMAKIRWNTTYFYVEGSVFLQSFFDANITQDHQKIYNQFHPHLSLYTSDQLFQDIQIYAWYKPASRAPSFNELYYSQVGNLSLIPEESAQLNLGIEFLHHWDKIELSVKGNIFKNSVRHKILALPTKNLFVWSIQNIGKVAILGGDLQFNAGFSFLRDWKIKIQAGASYQSVKDVSDSKSPTYGDQIAYMPALTGNTLASVYFQEIGLHFSGLYLGERYSLNENIPMNYLPAYFVLNLSGSYAFKWKDKHTLRLHAGIKNMANTSYNFIRYFVMPGRNYYLKLSYEFN